MEVVIDISGETFECIDFCEAYLDFNCPIKLEDTLTFKVWGAVLFTSKSWQKNRLNLLQYNLSGEYDNYISGFATLKVEKVIGGEFGVAIYDNKNKNGFIKSLDGEIVRLNRSWKYEKTSNLFTYIWECVSDWPHGYCHLEIASQGKVTLTFRTENCISVDEFTKDVGKYSFKR